MSLSLILKISIFIKKALVKRIFIENKRCKAFHENYFAMLHRISKERTTFLIGTLAYFLLYHFFSEVFAKVHKDKQREWADSNLATRS